MLAVWVIFLTSLVPLPLLYVLRTQPWMVNPVTIPVVGVVVLTLILIVPYLFVRRLKKPDFILYVMSLFTFACIIDLMIALESDGLIPQVMYFYLQEGEPYLWTAWGTMTNYWDGVVHYSCCLWILYCVNNGRSYRQVGLFWVGSITNSLLVLIMGSVVGKFGIKYAVLLNTPYLVVPVWVGYKLLATKPPHIQQTSSGGVGRLLDLVFVVYFMFGCVVDFIRAGIVLDSKLDLMYEYNWDHVPHLDDPVAYRKIQMLIYLIVLGSKVDLMYEYSWDHEPYLGDPVAYPKIQMLIYLMYFVPFYCCAIYGLINRGQLAWLADWALIYAGAAAQGQFVHMGASVHYKTEPEFRVPDREHSRNIFWLLNIGLFVGPLLFALWENYRPAKTRRKIE